MPDRSAGRWQYQRTAACGPRRAHEPGCVVRRLGNGRTWWKALVRAARLAREDGGVVWHFGSLPPYRGLRPFLDVFPSRPALGQRAESILRPGWFQGSSLFLHRSPPLLDLESWAPKTLRATMAPPCLPTRRFARVGPAPSPTRSRTGAAFSFWSGMPAPLWRFASQTMAARTTFGI